MINIPTIQQLRTAIKADIETAFGNNIPSFGKNFLRALTFALAGILKLFYLAIAFLQKNIFVDTADPESQGGTLERFGRVKLGRNPFPATAGQYEIVVTGSVGAIIPASTTFKSNDDATNPGKLFILDSAFTLVTNPDTIVVRALEAGVESKMQVGEGMTSTSPLADISRSTTVATETVEPRAAETIEDYRAKALEAYRLESQGGAVGDYRIWSADAQGVKQVYPYSASGTDGEVNLYIEANVVDSIDGKGTPSAGLISDVEDVVELDPDITRPINERGRRPLQVIVNFLPITPLNVEINISGFVGLTGAIQTLIFEAIKGEIDKIRPFIGGADILADKSDILDSNKIINTILNVRPGSVFGAVTFKVDGVTVSSYVFDFGNIPYIQSSFITYV